VLDDLGNAGTRQRVRDAALALCAKHPVYG